MKRLHGFAVSTAAAAIVFGVRCCDYSDRQRRNDGAGAHRLHDLGADRAGGAGLAPARAGDGHAVGKGNLAAPIAGSRAGRRTSGDCVAGVSRHVTEGPWISADAAESGRIDAGYPRRAGDRAGMDDRPPHARAA